jgi:hypothetical protein
MIKQLREFTAKVKRLSLSLCTTLSPRIPSTNECSKCYAERIERSRLSSVPLGLAEPDILLWTVENRFFARALSKKGKAQIGPGVAKIRDIEGFVGQFADDIKLTFDPLYSR